MGMDKSKAERPLGIVSALPEEMGGLGLALAKADVVEVAGYHFHHGRVDGHPVVYPGAGSLWLRGPRLLRRGGRARSGAGHRRYRHRR